MLRVSGFSNVAGNTEARKMCEGQKLPGKGKGKAVPVCVTKTYGEAEV
jgi:hypothetical protein